MKIGYQAEPGSLTVVPKSGKKGRFGLWAIGFLTNKAITYGFDYLIYPFVIWKLGIIKGGVAMALLSFLLCWATFVFYDWAKKDWIGIETMKELREYQGAGVSGRLIAWMMRKGDIMALLFLSIYLDPFVTTAYLRRGAHRYNGLSKRDWLIFLSSLFIGNFYWTLITYTGVTFLQLLSRNLTILTAPFKTLW